MRKTITTLKAYCTATVLCAFFAASALAADSNQPANFGSSVYDALVLEVDEKDVDGSISKLENEGVIVLRHRDNLLLALVPLQNLGDVDNGTEAVKRMVVRRSSDNLAGKRHYVPSRNTLTMNHARKWYDAYKILEGKGLPQAYDGRGIVVGICDVGFDANHINFTDSIDGEPRLKRIVQYKESEGKRIEMNSPAEFRTWVTDDPEQTHCTHVAGIAAGSFRPSDRYGMAPGADIVVTVSELSDVGLLAGVEDIIEYAKSVQKPAVINLSVGNYIGPHDGTGLFSRYLDKCGYDAIICISAGNEGNTTNTLSMDFSDTAESLTYKTQSTDAEEKSVYGITDIWMEDDTPCTLVPVVFDLKDDSAVVAIDEVDLQKSSHYIITDVADDFVNEDPTTVILGNNQKFNSSLRGYLRIMSERDSSNGRFHVQIHNDVFSRDTLEDGSIRYVVGGIVKAPAGKHADLYADGTQSHFMPIKGVSPVPDAHNSISDLATGHNVICVGLYTNSEPVTRFDGKLWAAGTEPGTMSVYNGYGTLIDGRVLPATSAPGIPVVSSYSHPYLEKYYYMTPMMSYMTDGTPDCDPNLRPKDIWKSEEGMYYWGPNGGTSMSCPYVAGSVATWLQANPDLKVADVQEIIKSTNDRDGAASYTTDPRNGQGWFRPYEGIQAVLKNVPAGDNHTPLISSIMRLVGRDLYLAQASGDLVIYRADGTTILRTEADSRNSISLAGLQPGLYIARLADGNSLKFRLE